MKDDCFNYTTFYQAIIMRLADRRDPWVRDTFAWWNVRLFGNVRGKVTIKDPADEVREKWRQFVQRREGRKAALEATRQEMAGP